MKNIIAAATVAVALSGCMSTDPHQQAAINSAFQQAGLALINPPEQQQRRPITCVTTGAFTNCY